MLVAVRMSIQCMAKVISDIRVLVVMNIFSRAVPITKS